MNGNGERQAERYVNAADNQGRVETMSRAHVAGFCQSSLKEMIVCAC